jgi:hypothetical protein
MHKKNQRLAEEKSAFIDTKKKLMRSPRQQKKQTPQK